MFDLIPEDEAFTASLTVTSGIELKLLSESADAGLIEGMAASFNGIDLHGDTILPGSFAGSLEAHRASGTAPAFLFSHDQSQPIGRLTAAGETAGGLRIRAALNLGTEAGKRAHAHLLARDISGLSIGFTVPTGGARRGENGGRVLTMLNLHEVSIVAIPADTNARVTQVKSLANRGELEQLLHSSGLSRGAARKLAAGGWPALARETSEEDFSVLEKALDTQLLELRQMRRHDDD